MTHLIRTKWPSRQEDERDLEMLQMRDDGWRLKDIAEHFGYTPSGLRGKLYRMDAAYQASLQDAAK